MRYAIVSDIHANWQAWSAVRDDIRNRAVDTTVCLGDIVGYGPSPTRVFSDLLARCDNFVLGNHDAAAAGKLDPSVFNENARRSTEWTAAQFDRASLKQLGEVPLVLEDEDILFVHAETPAPDEFGYVETTDDARACFEATEMRFIFIGHTHRPTVFALERDGTVTESSDTLVRPKDGVRYLVNVGSVGDPGDGTDLASYCIFDSTAGEISLRKVAFDVAAFREELSKVPELTMPWFLQRHEGEAVRPSYDQAVAVGKVAGTKIRVASSRSKIRVKASALATHAGDSLRVTHETSKVAAKTPRRSNTGVIVGLICLAAAGAMTGTYFYFNRKTPAPPLTLAATVAAPAPTAPAAPDSRSPAILPAFSAIASREEIGDGKANVANLAVDGNPNTRWSAGDKLAGHWIQIDLGAEMRLTGVKIAWEYSDATYGFKIEGSSNTRTWTDLAADTGKSSDLISFAANARYIRIFVTKLPDQKSASIAEITFFDGGGREIKTAPPMNAAAIPVAKVTQVAQAGATSAVPTQREDSLARVPEAKDYKLVYDLDLAKLKHDISYDVDNTTSAPRFDRVAYLVELKKGSEPMHFVWVSMDAFTTEARKLGVPTVASGIHFQQSVANITVVSDAAGIKTGERIGAGNIEFWPNNYGPMNSANVPGASGSAYDFGDGPATPVDGYGSMQVHNTAAKQTIFAINHWNTSPNSDLGIGNSGGSSRGKASLDWTFSGNGASYSAKRLRIFVHPAP